MRGHELAHDEEAEAETTRSIAAATSGLEGIEDRREDRARHGAGVPYIEPNLVGRRAIELNDDRLTGPAVLPGVAQEVRGDL